MAGIKGDVLWDSCYQRRMNISLHSIGVFTKAHRRDQAGCFPVGDNLAPLRKIYEQQSKLKNFVVVFELLCFNLLNESC